MARLCWVWLCLFILFFLTHVFFCMLSYYFQYPYHEILAHLATPSSFFACWLFYFSLSLHLACSQVAKITQFAEIVQNDQTPKRTRARQTVLINWRKYMPWSILVLKACCAGSLIKNRPNNFSPRLQASCFFHKILNEA